MEKRGVNEGRKRGVRKRERDNNGRVERERGKEPRKIKERRRKNENGKKNN